MHSNKKKIVSWILFLLYCVLILFLFFHHENWRDEAQAYLLCRDMNFKELFLNVHYEGHPILYYALLYPFVKMGVGIKIVNIFSLVFMISSVYLLLFRLKTSNAVKGLILFSYPVLYEFSVIGRSYSLIFFLLMCYAFFYPMRHQHPIWFVIILGLLLNTHLLLFGFVGMNFFLLLYELYFTKLSKKEKKYLYYGIAILFLFGLFFFWQFYPVLLPNDGLRMNEEFTIFGCFSFLMVLLSFMTGYYTLWGAILSFLIQCVILVFMFQKKKEIFFLYFGSLFFMAFLLKYVLGGISIYHMASAYSLFFSCLIIFEQEIPWQKFCFLSLMVLSSLVALKAGIYDVFYPYSHSVEAATFIKKNIDPSDTIICNCDHMCSSLIPYVSNPFYFTNTKENFTYLVWKQKRDDIPNFGEIGDYIQTQNQVYYIYTGYNPEDILIVDYLKQNYSIELIYESQGTSYTEEDYQIYRIGNMLY